MFLLEFFYVLMRIFLRRLLVDSSFARMSMECLRKFPSSTRIL